MKKFIFSCLFFSLLAFGAQAQHACCKAGSKSCEAKAPSSASASVVSPENSAAAAKVAASDETIETRTDPITGNVSYVRQVSAENSAEASFVSVSFDPVTNSFVNVSPMSMEEGHNSSMKSSNGKSCCSMGNTSGKSCCSGKTASAKPGEKTKS